MQYVEEKHCEALSKLWYHRVALNAIHKRITGLSFMGCPFQNEYLIQAKVHISTELINV